MKELTKVCTAGAGVVGLFQWAQIAYRLNLFLASVGGERGVNHIGNGNFALIYTANAIMFVAVVVALRVLWQGRAWRLSSVTVGVVNGFGGLTVFTMHRVGALVE